MKKLIIGVLIVGIISMLMGCNNEQIKSDNEKITIDYADYPEDFMIQLKPGQKYTLKNGDTSKEFCADTKGASERSMKMKYGDIEADLSSDVYYQKTEPVLIHCNDKDYIWICEESEYGDILSASFYYVTEYNSLSRDNGIVNTKIGDEVLDPNDFVMSKVIDCFGFAATKVPCRINEQGKPEEIQTDDEYYIINAPYTEDKMRLEDDIHTWVYADADSKSSSVEIIPAGTFFYRLRVPKNEEYGYVEGILEDGRVFRVVEEYKFSEPSSYQVMRDKEGKQFDYSYIDSDE